MLSTLLVSSAQNAELKALPEAGLSLFNLLTYSSTFALAALYERAKAKPAKRNRAARVRNTDIWALRANHFFSQTRVALRRPCSHLFYWMWKPRRCTSSFAFAGTGAI